MSQVFKGQTSLVISLDTGLDMTGASESKILYKKPNGVLGEWPATVTTTILSRQVQNNDIDMAGTWSFQAYAVLSGKKYYGQIQQQVFMKPLNSAI